MKISIAMTTYNGERFVHQQLHSFISQTRQPDELIVSDDGSSDSTLSIVDEFAARAPFAVHVHRNETNLGYSGNFNAALARCKGDLIFLSDQDDVWFADKLARIEAIFLANPDVWVVINDAELTDAELNPSGINDYDRLRSLGLGPESFIPGCCTAIRRQMQRLAIPIPYEDAVFVHDAWIHELGALLRVRRVVPDALQYYRRHGQNTSSWVGNSCRKIRRMDLDLATWPQDSRVRCTLRYRQLNALADRLSRQRVEMSLSLPDLEQRLERALKRIVDEKRAVERRLCVLAHRKWSRLLPAFMMLAAGDYQYFSSWRSFMKDIVTGITRRTV